MKHSPVRALAVVGAALVLMVGGGFIAYAAIPSANGVIRACYDSGGNVKLIDEGASCPKNWKGPISWHQAGQPGADGVSGRELVRVDGVETIEGNLDPSRVFFGFCPDGKVAVGGGGNVGINSQLAGSRPFGITQSGWAITSRPAAGGNYADGTRIDWVVEIVCVNAN